MPTPDMQPPNTTRSVPRTPGAGMGIDAAGNPHAERHGPRFDSGQLHHTRGHMTTERDDTQPIPVAELPPSERQRSCREGGCDCGECLEA